MARYCYAYQSYTVVPTVEGTEREYLFKDTVNKIVNFFKRIISHFSPDNNRRHKQDIELRPVDTQDDLKQD